MYWKEPPLSLGVCKRTRTGILIYTDGDQVRGMTAMNSLWHHIVVLATVPVLFSVILNDFILLTRWPRILTFESVLGTFRFWEQLPMGREGRLICGERVRCSPMSR